jgi:hypothetical protein
MSKQILATSALLFAAFAANVMAKPVGSAYPSGPCVPENLLRIELRFSEPVETPIDINHVKLFDANGRIIPGAFLDLPLPSADGRMVTILMHPARVKTGVGANLALGRALHRGETVTFVVDDPILARPVRRTWRVTGFDAAPPKPANWTFELPRAGSRDPVVVHLDKPLSLTAQSLIAIRTPEGDRMAGNGVLQAGETVWRFVPAQPWRPSTYSLVTHPDLEDSAGNRPCGPFEAVDASSVRCDKGTTADFRPTDAAASDAAQHAGRN